MDISQDVKNKLMVRSDYLDWITKETAIFAYLDLTNMFHWQNVLGWKFKLYDIKNKYIDFGKFYTGKREYISENPALRAGPHN